VLQHIADCGTQTKSIVLKPALLNRKTQVISVGKESEIHHVTFGHHIQIRFQLPAFPESERVVEIQEEYRLLCRKDTLS